MNLNFIKKMNIKGIGCDPLEARQKENKDKIVELCIIYGRASGTKGGENRTTGDVWEALTGRFEAVNLQAVADEQKAIADNNIAARDAARAKIRWESGMLFIPGGVQELIMGTIESGAKENTIVEFAVKVSARYDEDSITGYRYVVSNVAPPTQADELSAIRKTIAALAPGAAAVLLPSLPAPETPAPPATEPAPPATTEAPKPAPVPTPRRR